jgi:hypothetical protein
VNSAKRGTRTYIGTPGNQYWQNHTDYHIKLYINPQKNVIKGNQKMTYFNNSPDTLNFLIIRLYQNLFKEGAPRTFPVSPKDVHGGVNIKKISIEGHQEYDLDNMLNIRGTLAYLRLKEPLNSQDSICCNIEFETPFPEKTKVRNGIYKNGQAWFVSYFYPQIAVYDDLYGWDRNSFSGTSEFYNDFNDFSLDVVIPSGYMVDATGMLMNPGAVLNNEVLDRFLNAKKSDTVVTILRPGESLNSGEKKIWRFEAKNVTDVAFCLAKDYCWDGISMEREGKMDPVFISAVYAQGDPHFHKNAALTKEILQFSNDKWPGISYPYPAMTIFAGHGGMEYPMIVNDGAYKDWYDNVFVTSHEIAHTYFPFLTGINETRYAWMDEGWAVWLPVEYQISFKDDPVPEYIARYEQFAGISTDVPLMVPSSLMGQNGYLSTYRHNAYYKSAVSYQLLYDYLGERLFRKALMTYISRWKGKHPSPYDFFNTFEDVSGKDLGWFWKDWFFSFGVPDLSIDKVDIESNYYKVTVKQKGNYPVPIKLRAMNNEEVIYEKVIPMDVWKSGLNRLDVKIKSSPEVKKLILGNEEIPDVHRTDNIYFIPGLGGQFN